jgi:hypothetical protein
VRQRIVNPKYVDLHAGEISGKEEERFYACAETFLAQHSL